MNYTDAELDTFEQENYFKELEQDIYLSAKPMQSASLIDLKTSDNPEKFQMVDSLISKGESLSMKFGIDDGLPYYKIRFSPEREVMLYLNREVVQYLYSWIKDGVRLPQTPNTWDVQKRANEKYMLVLMKRDRAFKALRFNTTTQEYKAIYPKGTIIYGALPYTTDELVTKLNEL